MFNLVPESLKNLQIIPSISEFEEVDISKALTAPGRFLYPKIAKKSSLDDLLGRRLQLKVMEERKIAQQVKTEDANNDEEAGDDTEDVDLEGDGGLEKQLNNMMSGKVTSAQTEVNREMLNSIAKKIHSIRLHYTAISKLGNDLQCYSQGCNTNSSTLSTNCYSPICLQRSKVRRELLAQLKRANMQANAAGLSKIPNLLNIQQKKPASILEQKLTEPQKPQAGSTKNMFSEVSLCKDFASAVLTAPKCNNEDNTIYIPKKVELKEDKSEDEDDLPLIPNSVDNEIKMEVDEKSIKKLKNESESDVDVDMDVMTPDDIKEMILGSSHKKRETRSATTIKTTTHVTRTQTTTVDSIVKSSSKSKSVTDTVTNVSNGTGKTIQTLNAKTTTYTAQQNRRFCAYRTTVKKEEKTLKTEHAEDGTERIFSAKNTEGKIYLKKVAIVTNEKRKKRQIVKYPICSTFQTRKHIRSILVLPKHDIRKLARNAGRIQIQGFHQMAKPNNSVWPYPCARPLFKTCWVYRTVNLKSLAAVSLQLKILWACLRWDDMQVKPPNSDGKHQITTETEILSLELLKHRHIGPFLEKTQYLRRKVIIPLELPKTVRGNCYLEFLIRIMLINSKICRSHINKKRFT